jgi:hypothetical protein
MTTKTHNWTPIAPESNAALDHSADSDVIFIWKWCTRCGSLRLGTEVFHPGKNQKKTIVSVKDMAAKKPTEESVETLEQECKGTTYT